MTRALAAAAVAGSAAVLVATPAHAATTCSEHQRIEFDTPGFNTDMRVRLCVYHGQPTRGAYAQVSWTNGGDNAADGSRKFDSLVIHYELQSDGAAVTSGSCDLTGRINIADSSIFTCQTAYHESSRPGGWGTTGYILYNVDRDGEGVKQISLTGSPVVAS